jgi:antitoxin component YwqK of YwqJK toxin-antitoxin module
MKVINKTENQIGNDVFTIEREDNKTSYYKNGQLHRDDDLPAVEFSNGDKHYYKNGQLHRDNDLPAIEDTSGTKIYYKNGKIHRDGDKPAVEYAVGTKEWYKNGQLHRDGGLPAIVKADGTQEFYMFGQEVETMILTEGKLNNSHDPSIILKDGTKIWFKDGLIHRDGDEPAVKYSSGEGYYKQGLLHRTDGPAFEDLDGVLRYYFEGKEFPSLRELQQANLVQPQVSKNFVGSMISKVQGSLFHSDSTQPDNKPKN